MNHQGDIVQEDGEVSSPGDGYNAAAEGSRNNDGAGREWDRNREYERDRDRRRRSRFTHIHADVWIRSMFFLFTQSQILCFADHVQGLQRDAVEEKGSKGVNGAVSLVLTTTALAEVRDGEAAVVAGIATKE